MNIRPEILVVDDRPENLYSMNAILRVLDAEVIYVTSGEEALRLSLEHDFCLAIVDVQMPGMDGYELVSLFRGNMNTNMLPVIFVSAIYMEDYHFQKGYDSGAVDFLSKPVNADILLSKVKVFIQLWQQKQELQQLISQLSDWNKYLENTVQQRTESLEQVNNSLAQRVRLQNELFIIAARELDSALSGVHRSVSSLVNAEDRHIVDKGQVSEIQASEIQINEIVSSMADSTQIYEKLSGTASAPALLQDIIASVCNEFQPLLQERNLTIAAENLNSLPSLQIDGQLIELLFRRVIQHALHHSAEGDQLVITGEQLPAGVLPQKDRDTICINITFQGPGLDDNYRQWISTIFQPSESASSILMEENGILRESALGLIVAKKIIAAHEGLLWAETLPAEESGLSGMVIRIALLL